MKTIKSFLIGMFLLTLAIATFMYAMVLLSNATTIYNVVGETATTTFTTTFVLTSVILVAVSLQLLILSIGSFKLFRKYYNLYIDNKRDRDIKQQLLEEKYLQLYRDIADAPTLELKEAVVDTFYKETGEEDAAYGNKLHRIMEQILKNN